MPSYVINSQELLQSFLGDVRTAFNKHHFLRITVKTGKQRTIDQNSVIHLWFEQIARELPEDNALGWKNYSKLHFGVPILRASSDPSFREFYDTALLHQSYEFKLQAMNAISITSRMSTDELTQFMSMMQEDFSRRGVILEVKEPANG